MKNIKVMLVDDEESFALTLAERMQMRHATTTVAHSGQEALDALAKGDIPDVMILDLRMPGMDGLEVLRHVKELHRKIQVIILTGHGTEKEEEEARRLGAYEYHKKPVDINVLVDSIKKAFREKLEDALVAATMAEAGL
ncbi:MAG: response regulator [Pseudomonadota bacterium]